MSKRTDRFTVPIEGLLIDHKLIRMLVQFTLKNGKKSLAVRLVNAALINLTCEMNCSLNELADVIDDVESKMPILVGFFKRRMGSKSYRIPYMLTPERSYKHSLKRFYKVVMRTKGSMGFSNALSREILNLHRGTNSEFANEKNRIYREAKAGRILSYMIQRFKVRNPENLRVDVSKLNEI